MTDRRDKPVVDRPAKLKGFDDYQTFLGDIMRGERATLGKSLLDVQRELKIKAAYIAAIENSDPTAFRNAGVCGRIRPLVCALSGNGPGKGVSEILWRK